MQLISMEPHTYDLDRDKITDLDKFLKKEHSIVLSWSVLYPELFWSWYTGLGSQTQTPKCSKVLISGVSFHQHSLSQSQEGNVLSYSEHKIAKNFQGFTPVPHWGGLTAVPQTPRLHSGFSPHYTCQKTGTPQKLLDTALLMLLTIHI